MRSQACLGANKLASVSLVEQKNSQRSQRYNQKAEVERIGLKSQSPQSKEPFPWEQQLRTLAPAKPSSSWDRLSPTALAYVGDAVYEVLIRTRYLLPPKRIRDYHRLVVEQVRAESQAKRLQQLEPQLSALERDLLRRGRNAATRCPRRLAREIYQQASSFETLVGYLFLNDPQRLIELLTSDEEADTAE